jgi:hypothetical protein
MRVSVTRSGGEDEEVVHAQFDLGHHLRVARSSSTIAARLPGMRLRISAAWRMPSTLVLCVSSVPGSGHQFVELDQQVAVDLFQAGQVQQHQVAAFGGQGVDDLAGQRGRQEGQEHRLHLHVLVDDVFGQPFRRSPLQARHLGPDRVAVDVVQHAVRDVAAQRHVQRALQVAARGAVHAALLAVIVEEGLHRVLTASTLMPLMRDITCVTSSNSSRDRQRSTLAAGSSPMLSSTMAACSTGSG